MTVYRIAKWDEYQHYKDRDPPWIKLHRDMLTSRTWVTLDDAGRTLAVACMLVAAGTGNRIPADPAFMRRRAYLTTTPDFAPLVAVGFLEVVSEINALPEIRKPMLAPRTQTLADACSEGEAEQREILDKSPTSSTDSTSRKPRSAEPKGSRLSDDWRPSAEDRAFAADLGLDPESTADEFRDFWTAVPGARGRKLDWSKTFKNRCRELGKRPHAAGRGESRQDQRSREIQEAIERSRTQ